MEQLKFSFRQFIYLSGGLFLILAVLLFLKFAYPEPIINSLSTEIPTKQVTLNWDLLRRPISIELPSLNIIFSAFPQSTTSGAYIDLTAEVLGVSQGPFVYHFDCEGDGIFELETGESFQKKYTAEKLCFFNQEGTYTAKAFVDGIFDFFQDGQEINEKRTIESQAKIVIQTTNLAPVFSQCDVDSIEGTTQVDFKFNFTSEAIDPNGDEIQYEWDLGDGNKIQGQNIDYSYKTRGSFIPKVKATDSNGVFSYCVAKKLMVFSELSSLEAERSPGAVVRGRQDPFSPVNMAELLKIQATTTKPIITQPTTTQATTTKPIITQPTTTQATTTKP